MNYYFFGAGNDFEITTNLVFKNVGSINIEYNTLYSMKYLVSVLVIIIFILTTFIAYFAGKQNVLPVLTKNPTVILAPTSTPQDTPNPLQIIKGGGILSFPHYQLKAGADWIYSREAQGQDNEKIILQNGSYGLSITQGGFGGAICLYPGDADTEGPSARYNKYIEITTNSGDKLRRSTPDNGKGFGICQLTQYGWGAPTLYGHISLTVPSNPTPEMLKEIDGILASLTKI